MNAPILIALLLCPGQNEMPKAQADSLRKQAHKKVLVGEHAQAATLFRKAFEVSKLPSDKFNEAAAWELAGDCVKILATWDAYLTACAQKCRDLQAGQARFQKAQERCLADSEFTSDPHGARLMLEFGATVKEGKTPFKAQLIKGQWRLRVELDGYDTVEKDITLIPKQPLRLHIPLQRQKGQVLLENFSGQMQALVNGEKVVPPTREVEVPAGPAEITLVDKRGRRSVQNVVVKPRKTVTIDLGLVFPPEAKSPYLAIGKWTSTGLAAIGLGLGVAFQILMQGTINDYNAMLTGGSPSARRLLSLRDEGLTQARVRNGTFGAAIGLAAIAGLLFYLDHDSDASQL